MHENIGIDTGSAFQLSRVRPLVAQGMDCLKPGYDSRCSNGMLRDLRQTRQKWSQLRYHGNAIRDPVVDLARLAIHVNDGPAPFEFIRLRAGLPDIQAAAQHQQQVARSEEHTSELQSLRHLVCRLLLE